MSLSAHNNALHVPVLLQPIIDLLTPALQDEAVLIDCTLGMGGHSEAFLTAFPKLKVVGIDRDAQAISLASERLSQFGERFTAVHTTYDDVDQVAAQFGHDGQVDAILMDMGVSSLQLDETDRGFPTRMMLRLICGWIPLAARRQLNCSPNFRTQNSLGSYECMVRKNSLRRLHGRSSGNVKCNLSSVPVSWLISCEKQSQPQLVAKVETRQSELSKLYALQSTMSLPSLRQRFHEPSKQ